MVGYSGQFSKCVDILDVYCKYCCGSVGGFEMAKLIHFDRHDIMVLHQHDHSNIICFGNLRLLHSRVCISIPFMEYRVTLSLKLFPG